MQNTYLPLLTYAHADGAAGTRLIPALAKGLPKITDGGRLYTLFLRPGLEYSDGTPVRASDFPFVVERLFRANSPGLALLHRHRRRRTSSLETKAGRHLRHRDRRRDAAGSSIQLMKPRGTFSNELGLLYVALLPRGTPANDQTEHPPPATGPYEITASTAAGAGEYARNPAWAATNAEAMPDLPGGHVDAIRIDGRQPTPATPGERRRKRQVRLDEEPAAAGPHRRGQGEVRGHPVPRRNRRSATSTSG